MRLSPVLYVLTRLPVVFWDNKHRHSSPTIVYHGNAPKLQHNVKSRNRAERLDSVERDAVERQRVKQV